MPGIPEELTNQLRESLLKCEEFQSNANLQSLFVNQSISPWKANCPEANDLSSRVDTVINYLVDKHSDTQENALVLLLKVLNQRKDKGDRQHQKLVDLVNNLEEAIAKQKYDEVARLKENFIYLERHQIESKCEHEISRRSGLIRIKAPRHMGKTYFNNQILDRAKKKGFITVNLDLEQADSNVFNDLDGFLRWFCLSTVMELNNYGFRFSERSEDYWDANRLFTSKVHCTSFFEEDLLNQIHDPVFVLSIDNIDRLYENIELADNFFALLRTWHGYTKTKNIWIKFRLILTYSSNITVSNAYQSPFNLLGLLIKLPEFSPEEILNLARQHGLKNWNIEHHVVQLMQLLGGHPYLVVSAISYIANQSLILESFLNSVSGDDGIYNDHLEQHLLRLESNSNLKIAMKKVVDSNENVWLPLEQANILESMGLIVRKRNNVLPRCQLYRLYFQNSLRVVT
jgi:AAA-like domain